MKELGLVSVGELNSSCRLIPEEDNDAKEKIEIMKDKKLIAHS